MVNGFCCSVSRGSEFFFARLLLVSFVLLLLFLLFGAFQCEVFDDGATTDFSKCVEGNSGGGHICVFFSNCL